MRVTADTITDEQIRALRDCMEDADDGGAIWVVCIRALNGNDAARARCAEIINARAKAGGR